MQMCYRDNQYFRFEGLIGYSLRKAVGLASTAVFGEGLPSLWKPPNSLQGTKHFKQKLIAQT